mgnify:CR=1 FL=1
MKKVVLGEVCDFFNGGAWSDKEYVNEGIPVLKVTNCKSTGFQLDNLNYLSEKSREKYKKNNLIIGDIIVATVGSHPNLIESAAGRSCIVNSQVEGFYLNQNAVCIRTKDKRILSQKYLGYLCKCADFQHYIQSRGRGAANQMRIAISSIKEYSFTLPDFENQQYIADILSAYDDLIENNQKQIKLLEEAAQRLYKEWFVDLHFPGHENTKIVDGVPERWSRGLLKELISVNYGKDHKKAPDDGNIPVYGSGGLMRKCNKSLFSGEAVLIPRKGSLNNIMYVDETFWTVDTMFYATMKQPHTAVFVYFVVKAFDMYSMNIGAAVPSMTAKILDAMDVVIPDKETLEKFDKLTKTYFNKIKTLQGQNERLKTARNLLLPKLMYETQKGDF